MRHVTSIGLDVHARSITAVALDSITGEVVTQRFGNSSAEVASWILKFESPKAVYESGVTGFHLVRELRNLGVDCIVGAVSKMQRPAADKRRKNDRNDAEFLARQLLAHNVVEVFVPDEETEAARSLSRVLEDIRDDLTRAKHRLTHLLIRWGHAWDERTPRGQEARHLDAGALGVDQGDRASRERSARIPRLLHLGGAPHRGAEEGHREEDCPVCKPSSLERAGRGASLHEGNRDHDGICPCG